MPVSIAMKSRVDYRISAKIYIRHEFYIHTLEHHMGIHPMDEST